MDYEDEDFDYENNENAIVKIVELATKLEIFVLKMPSCILDDNVYLKIAKIRQVQQRKCADDDKKPLVLYIGSDECLENLGSQYDENCVEIRIKDFLEWEFNPI